MDRLRRAVLVNLIAVTVWMVVSGRQSQATPPSDPVLVGLVRQLREAQFEPESAIIEKVTSLVSDGQRQWSVDTALLSGRYSIFVAGPGGRQQFQIQVTDQGSGAVLRDFGNGRGAHGAWTFAAPGPVLCRVVVREVDAADVARKPVDVVVGIVGPY